MSSLLAKKKKAMQYTTKVNTLNTPYLVIVESPSKCAKIEKFLGMEYKCIASKGHIRELTKVGTKKQHYLPTYDLIPEKLSHVSYMKSIVSQFLPGNVYVGTDDDREGEAIAWHICMVCNLSPYNTKRILFNEITKSAIQRAVSSPSTVRMNIVRAQQARQVLDRMIGFKISPFLTKMIAHDNGKFLSAGRCQTPTLRLIYDKHEASKEKTLEVNHKVRGTFFQDPSKIQGTLDKTFPTIEDVDDFFQKSTSFSHIFHLELPKEKALACPKPFNTSSLLQFASSQLHISPKRVMECCQTLYQDGHITYMRTDSREYAKEFLDGMRNFLLKSYNESYLGDFSRIMNKDDKNPHEAIRVTDLETKEIEYKDKKIVDVYRLLWKRTVESCMSPYQYNEYKIQIEAPSKSHYKGTVEEPVFLGWKRVSMNQQSLKSMQLETMKKVEYWKHYNKKVIPFHKIESTLSVTNREKHYQESGLIQALESLGIGRPSTYSMLVDTIQERKYVSKEDIDGEVYNFDEKTLSYPDTIESKRVSAKYGGAKNQLCIQPIGVQSIQVLYEYFPTLFDYAYTEKMENELDRIVHDDTVEWYKVCEECEQVIQSCMKPLQAKMRQVYSIDDEHELLFGKTGIVVRVKGTKSFKTVKPDFNVNFEQLEQMDLKIEDIVELPKDCLGKYEDESMFLKKGPYGAYVEWGSKRENIDKLLKTNKISLGDVTLEMIRDYLEKTKLRENPMVLRVLNNHLSVRKGKGRNKNYIFYKTESMTKPTFLNIRKCPHDVLKDNSQDIVSWAVEQLKID